MKANRIEHRKHGLVLAICAICVISAILAVLCLGYDKLKALYLDQCVITDMSEQVTIAIGKMVKPDVIAENLELKVGANTALIDFDEKRKSMLRRIHTLREVSITRKLPNKVTVIAEERTPIAKLGTAGSRSVTGKVVDSEGMVFICQRGTQLLPTIYESKSPGTQPGQRLQGRADAALTLIKTCREPDFAELNILDASISKPDFIVMTLGNYASVKIAWDGMDKPTHASSEDLKDRLKCLVKAIRTPFGSNTRTWNATMPNAIFADTQEQH